MRGSRGKTASSESKRGRRSDENVAELRRKHKEKEREEEYVPSAREEREEVISKLRDQYRQF